MRVSLIFHDVACNPASLFTFCVLILLGQPWTIFLPSATVRGNLGAAQHMDQHKGKGSKREALSWGQQLARFGQQVVLAFAKFLALLLFIGMHWVLHWGIGQIVPEAWIKVRELLEGVVAAVFILLYVDQLFEMLAVFIPRLGTLHARFTRGHTQRD